MRGWVCRLQFLLVFSSAVILRSESRGTQTNFYCLRFETPPTRRSRSPYLYPPWTGWPGYTSFFVASYDSQGYGGGIRPHLHTGSLCEVVSESSWTLIVATASVKGDERGGQGHTSTSLLHQSAMWHRTVNTHCSYMSAFSTLCFVLSAMDGKIE
jgi:hypothetical protein